MTSINDTDLSNKNSNNQSSNDTQNKKTSSDTGSATTTSSTEKVYGHTYLTTGSDGKVVAVNSTHIDGGSSTGSLAGKRVYLNSDGTYTTNAGVSLDTKTGKVTVRVPEEYSDDDVVSNVKSLAKTLSQNYKANSEVKYTDPLDEDNEINTDDYINELNDAIVSMVETYDSAKTAKSNLIKQYGGKATVRKAIEGLSNEDLVKMASGVGDDTSNVKLTIPESLMTGWKYADRIRALESYNAEDGTVDYDDFANNFMDISGSITDDSKLDREDISNFEQALQYMLTDEWAITDSDDFVEMYTLASAVSQMDVKSDIITDIWGKGGGIERFDTSLWLATVDSVDKFATMVGNVSAFVFNGVTGGHNVDYSETTFTGEGQMLGDIYDIIQNRSAEMSTWNYVTSSDYREAYSKVLETQSNAETIRESGESSLVAQFVANGAAAIYSMAHIGENISLDAWSTAGQLSGSVATMTLEVMATNSLLNIVKGGLTSVITEATREAISATGTIAVSASEDMEGAVALAEMAGTGAKTVTQLTSMGGQVLAHTIDLVGGMEEAQLCTIANTVATIAKVGALGVKVAGTATSVLGFLFENAILYNQAAFNKMMASNFADAETKDFFSNAQYNMVVNGTLGLASIGMSGVGRGIKASKTYRTVSDYMSQSLSGATAAMNGLFLRLRAWGHSLNKTGNNGGVATGEALKVATVSNMARKASAGASVTQAAAADTFDVVGTTSSGVSEVIWAGTKGGSEGITEYEASLAKRAQLDSELTEFESITEETNKIIIQMHNKDVNPTVAGAADEFVTAQTDLLNIEKESGLLTEKEIKKNAKLAQGGDAEAAMAAACGYHSRPVILYAARSYDYQDVLAKLGGRVEDVPEEYAKALQRAKDALPEQYSKELIKIIDERILPSAAKYGQGIVKYGVNNKIYNESDITKYRTNPNWVPRTSRKDEPIGRFVKNDQTRKSNPMFDTKASIFLDDDDVLWVGAGINRQMNEVAVTIAHRNILKSAVRASGTSMEILVSSNELRDLDAAEYLKKTMSRVSADAIGTISEDLFTQMEVGEYRRATSETKITVGDANGVAATSYDDLLDVMQKNSVASMNSISSVDDIVSVLSDAPTAARAFVRGEFSQNVSNAKISLEHSDADLGKMTRSEVLEAAGVDLDSLSDAKSVESAMVSILSDSNIDLSVRRKVLDMTPLPIRAWRNPGIIPEFGGTNAEPHWRSQAIVYGKDLADFIKQRSGNQKDFAITVSDLNDVIDNNGLLGSGDMYTPTKGTETNAEWEDFIASDKKFRNRIDNGTVGNVSLDEYYDQILQDGNNLHYRQSGDGVKYDEFISKVGPDTIVDGSRMEFSKTSGAGRDGSYNITSDEAESFANEYKDMLLEKLASPSDGGKMASGIAPDMSGQTYSNADGINYNDIMEMKNTDPDGFAEFSEKFDRMKAAANDGVLSDDEIIKNTKRAQKDIDLATEDASLC